MQDRLEKEGWCRGSYQSSTLSMMSSQGLSCNCSSVTSGIKLNKISFNLVIFYNKINHIWKSLEDAWGLPYVNNSNIIVERCVWTEWWFSLTKYSKQIRRIVDLWYNDCWWWWEEAIVAIHSPQSCQQCFTSQPWLFIVMLTKDWRMRRLAKLDTRHQRLDQPL